MAILFAAIFFLASFASAQWNGWTDAESVKEFLLKASGEKKTYYSQYDWFAPRKNDQLNTVYYEWTKVQPLIYGVDFFYASGTYFDKNFIQRNRKNLVSIVKNAWRKYRAIPSFSWHLENPYVPSDFPKEMGCRYRFSKKIPNYPSKHRYVIREILFNEGERCGFGNRSGVDNDLTYKNPRAWFEDRTAEIANIISELRDDENRPIPVIIRLWHECDNRWMWWGPNGATEKEYKDFFILTEKLIKKNAPFAEILWAYGPNKDWEKDDFLKWYPGDEYVDIIGYDDYSIGKETVNLEENIERARFVSNIAKEKGKVAALFETANIHASSSENFFMDYLLNLLQAEGVSLGLIQTWAVGKFFTFNQRKDRSSFLNNSKIIVWN